jgi:hypothetical protein
VIRNSTVVFTTDVIQNILNSVTTILEYHEYFDYANHTMAQKAERLQRAQLILSSQCDFISGGMVQGQYPVEATRSRLRVMSTLLEQGDVLSTGEEVSSDLSFSKSEQEAYTDVDMPSLSLTPPSSSGLCLVSLDSVVYNDLTEDLLKSNSLGIVWSNSSVSSDSIMARQVSEDVFSMTLVDVADMDLQSVLPRTPHNVTCSELDFGSTLYVACPHNMTHELYCDEGSTGVWEVTCPEVTTNMTCQSLRVLRAIAPPASCFLDLLMFLPVMVTNRSIWSFRSCWSLWLKIFQARGGPWTT